MCVSEIRVKRIRVNQGLGVVDFMFDADCMTRHPRSKNEQINLIMQEFTRHGLFRM